MKDLDALEEADPMNAAEGEVTARRSDAALANLVMMVMCDAVCFDRRILL